jgi:dUTPase
LSVLINNILPYRHIVFKQNINQTRAIAIFSLKPSTSSNAAINIPALNDFLLFPQAVPSRIPTRLYGPLPPQTFGLILGQSSLTSKEMAIHPEIIHSDYKKKFQSMMSSQIL